MRKLWPRTLFLLPSNSDESYNNSRSDNHFQVSSNKGKNKKRRFKLPDLNEEICCLNRLRLSSRLLCGRRVGFRKRGKSQISRSTETGSLETASSQINCSNEPHTHEIVLEGTENENDCGTPVALDDTEGEAGPGVDVMEGIGDSCSGTEDDGTMHLSNQQQSRNGDDQPVKEGQIEDEVSNTIMVNSLVQIDLSGHRDTLEAIIRNEGENMGLQ